MHSLLYVTASARHDGSLSRRLGDRFVAGWKKQHPSAVVLERDVGRNPPPFISEDWIKAAFTPASERSPEQHDLLELSDRLISELADSNPIVIATPMYNYGMPAGLKSWVDQIVRIGKTFTFDRSRGDFPLEPILSGKDLIILTSSGEFGFGAGELRDGMGHLVPHLKTVARYLGATRVFGAGIEYEEFKDERHEASIATTLERVDDLVNLLGRERAEVSATA
ncbi:NAD(P)H-dependent oxidoreductase [Rhodobacteraceae bacterium NNCM2]|nr:NAD(P)H-dependent oxidoreductase [Coraliihabitans acroporae]